MIRTLRKLGYRVEPLNNQLRANMQVNDMKYAYPPFLASQN
jgi:hypothetical protein